MIDDGKVGSLKCIEVGVPARMVIHRAFPFDSFDVTFKALRGRDQRDYKVVLLSDLGESHSKKLISECKKYGLHKTSTAEYTPQHNAFVERWF